MNKRECIVRLYKMAFLWNAFALMCISVGIIFTGSLWWLLILLTYASVDEESVE